MKKNHLLKGIQNARDVDPREMERYLKEMSERVIPEIKRVVEERKILASESRHRKIEILRAPDKKSD